MALQRFRNPQYHTVETTIGNSSIFVGILTSDGNVQIDGIFEGEVNTTLHVQVSRSGRVRAHLQAAACTVSGSVVGNIHATNDVVIESCARVWGQIEAPSLHVQPGAVFKGSSHGKDEYMDNE